MPSEILPHPLNKFFAPQILLDISDFSSIMAKIRQKRGYYPFKTTVGLFPRHRFRKK